MLRAVEDVILMPVVSDHLSLIEGSPIIKQDSANVSAVRIDAPIRPMQTVVVDVIHQPILPLALCRRIVSQTTSELTDPDRSDVVDAGVGLFC